MRDQTIFEKFRVGFGLIKLLYQVSEDFQLVMHIALSKWKSRYGHHIHPGRGFLVQFWVNFYGSLPIDKPAFHFKIVECAVHHYEDRTCINCGHYDVEAKSVKAEEQDFWCVCGFRESECRCETCPYCKKVTKALVKDIDSDGESEGEDGCDCIICDDCKTCINDDDKHQEICEAPDCKCEDVCPDCELEDCECSEC